jgi:hypothetical protein
MVKGNGALGEGELEQDGSIDRTLRTLWHLY